MIKVKIIDCSQKNAWYEGQIGTILNVVVVSDKYFCLYGLVHNFIIIRILRKDCKEIESI